MDDALFFNVLDEKVPLYRFKDKQLDYTDLNRAFDLAQAGYAAAAASFRRDAKSHWAAYVVGTLLVLARERGVALTGLRPAISPKT